MPLPLTAFPEFQALQLLCAQLTARISYLEEQIPDWVGTLEARRITNLSYASLRRVCQKPKSLIVCENGRYKRESLLAHNESRTISKAIILPVAKHPSTLSHYAMNQGIDLNQFVAFQEVVQQCQDLAARVAEVERKLPEWVDELEAQRLTGVSGATLRRERDKPKPLIIWKSDCGVHYERASLLAYLEVRMQVKPRGRRQS